MSALLYSPADLLSRLLVQRGQGGDPLASPLPLWPVYTNSEPAFPEELITVYDQQPRPDARDMTSGEHALHYGFEIRLRGGDQPTVFRRAEALRFWLLTKVQNMTITTPEATYLVPCVADVTLRGMGRDVPGSKRIRYAIAGVITLSTCP